jgi:hypothetical protein
MKLVADFRLYKILTHKLLQYCGYTVDKHFSSNVPSHLHLTTTNY